MKSLIFVISILLLVGIASASTVTLSGTCYSGVVNSTNNFVIFNLTNSGNGTATEFLLVPVLQGASSPNASMSIPLVAPGKTYTEKIYLDNFSIPGTYVERFVARYSQGTSTFETLFPCLVAIDQNAQSIIGITALSQSKSGTNITVNLSNIANYQINSQIALYAPPSFSIQNPVRNVTVKPSSTANASFGISLPQFTDSSFPVTVSVSYIMDGVHYATLAVTTISFGGGSAGTSSALGGNLILYGIIIVVVIIIALIAFSLIKKGGKTHSNPPSNETSHESNQGQDKPNFKD